MLESLHLDLDGALDADILGLRRVDALSWGPRLRFSAPAGVMEEFARSGTVGDARFLVSGSGDFHHLTALWLRGFTGPLVVVSFDNHPDWDLRPPRWACGGWVNRALELPQVQKVSVWGCGNFECWWPAQIFGNRWAENSGRLEIHPWADERPRSQQNRRGAIFAKTWRSEFERFAARLENATVYVTVDLDCLRPTEAITNWENGRFEAEEVSWAIRTLRAAAPLAGGDVCGAWSPPVYARAGQRFAAEFDRPKLPERNLAEARALNRDALEKIWPALTAPL